jgi:DnaJ family protein A protein 2
MIVIRDMGNSINQSIKGDVKITISVSNNSAFTRHGLDLVYKKKITLKEALCGFVFEIHHINGKNLCLNNKINKSVIKPNYKKVVPNLGMVRENSTGNMIIEFEIVFPDALTEEQIAGLENILL